MSIAILVRALCLAIAMPAAFVACFDCDHDADPVRHVQITGYADGTRVPLKDNILTSDLPQAPGVVRS